MDRLDRKFIQNNETAVKITVKGRVQGVGFRPFIYSLANEFNIYGTVQNNMDGVNIHAESCSYASISRFYQAIQSNPPRLSKIIKMKMETAGYKGYTDFTIIKSDSNGSSDLVIPIDAAVCKDCLVEVEDPQNDRYHYPFINCTQCGPRYTIISDLPYDRPNTSMAEFTMCPTCQKEYEDPENRRHHAQPIACPTCGPSLSLFKITGVKLDYKNPILEARKRLLAGNIVAIKGIGGYHLCCDAQNPRAVKELRLRKGRPRKPLAIMAYSMKEINRAAYVNKVEEGVLSSPEAPIVLLQKKYKNPLTEDISPGLHTVGVMLPYSPLHYLLLDEKELPYMVATSANPSGMPILYQDADAFDYLNNIADYILSHDRPILHPIDDSVVQEVNGEISLIRRSRGYAPDPLFSRNEVNNMVAFGGQAKNVFSIGRGKQMICGPHIGDMDHLEIQDYFKKELNHLLKWSSVKKELAIVDRHPYFATRSLAEEMGFTDFLEVQHHHAHMAGCMEDNQIEQDCYGIILDGTGYGDDGNIWGFEVLKGNKYDFQRIGHLKYTPLPGGDKAVKNPWRTAVGMLCGLFQDDGMDLSLKLFPNKEKEINMIHKMIQNKINTPMAGTCGRLYDAVSAILGICLENTYDGEAAIALSENANCQLEGEVYPFQWNLEKEKLYELDPAFLLEQIIQDKWLRKSSALIAGKFQWTLVQSIVYFMKDILQLEKDTTIVLSGGSFQNKYLAETLYRELSMQGFKVYTHKQLPPGDGGLAYGQMAIAAARKGK